MGSGWTSGDMIVLALLMAACAPCRGRSHEQQIGETPSTITARLGENVTIPCHPINEPNLTPSNFSVLCIQKLKNGEEIIVYKWTGSSHEHGRPGATIELKGGNVNLVLPHVQKNDEGEYNCTIIKTPSKYPSAVNLQLIAEPNVTLSTRKLTVENGMEKSVTCEVSGFYPEAVEVRWKKFSRSSRTWSILDTKTYLSKLKENHDGSFNVTSQLILGPVRPEQNGDEYSCVVANESISKDKSHKNASFVLIVTDEHSIYYTVCQIMSPTSLVVLVFILLVWIACSFLKVTPRISEIVGMDDLVHMKRSALTFMVVGFNPKNIEINMYLQRVKSSREHKIMSWKYPPPPQHGEDQAGKRRLINSNGSSIQPLRPMRFWMTHSFLCSTHITPDKERDEGAKLTIQVIHDGLRSPLVLLKTLTISDAEPVGKPFTFPNEEHQDGQ